MIGCGLQATTDTSFNKEGDCYKLDNTQYSLSTLAQMVCVIVVIVTPCVMKFVLNKLHRFVSFTYLKELQL